MQDIALTSASVEYGNLIQVDDHLYVFPGRTIADVACVALADGARCSVSFLDPLGTFEWTMPDGLGEITAANVLTPERQVLDQRCDAHYEAMTPNAVDAEWQVFHPSRHPSLIHQHAYRWTEDGLVRPEIKFPDQTDWAPFDLFAQLIEPEPIIETDLYRWYDVAGRLLYVGITGDIDVRSKRHANRSTWAQFAVRGTATKYMTRDAAARAEVKAIAAEMPLFNSQHADPDAAARLVAYLIERGRMDLLAPAISRG